MRSSPTHRHPAHLSGEAALATGHDAAGRAGVLDALVVAAHGRVAAFPRDRELARLRQRSRARQTAGSGRPDFRAALAGRGRLAVIAEFKRRSPSAGSIAEDLDLDVQVTRYARGGAAALSVLTEPTRFGGSYHDLARAAEVTGLPVLMKDFVVSPRQVELAADLGAAAVLLIVRCLGDLRLTELVDACRVHGLTALVECGDRAELERALAHRDVVLGLNNRDLDTLDVDPRRGRALLEHVPADRVVVAESGFRTPGDLAAVRGAADAVLVGTALMESDDPAAFLAAAGVPQPARRPTQARPREPS